VTGGAIVRQDVVRAIVFLGRVVLIMTAQVTASAVASGVDVESCAQVAAVDKLEVVVVVAIPINHVEANQARLARIPGRVGVVAHHTGSLCGTHMFLVQVLKVVLIGLVPTHHIWLDMANPAHSVISSGVFIVILYHIGVQQVGNLVAPMFIVAVTAPPGAQIVVMGCAEIGGFVVASSLP